MTIQDVLRMPEYAEVLDRLAPHKPLFFVLGGSHLYGTSTPKSDIDLRGAFLNTKEELLGLDRIDQLTHEATDTTIYAFMHFLRLLFKGTPNCVELLFAPEEEFAEVSPAGQLILNNKDLFLTKTTTKAMIGFATHSRITVEQGRALSHQAKNMMHSIRLLHMATEIFNGEPLKARRTDDLSLLMDLRDGKYINEDGTPKPEYFQLAEETLEETRAAEEKSKIPSKTNYHMVNRLAVKIHEAAIL